MRQATLRLDPKVRQRVSKEEGHFKKVNGEEKLVLREGERAEMP